MNFLDAYLHAKDRVFLENLSYVYTFFAPMPPRRFLECDEEEKIKIKKNFSQKKITTTPTIVRMRKEKEALVKNI